MNAPLLLTHAHSVAAASPRLARDPSMRSFEYDLLLDGLLSGRLAGAPVDARSAVVLLAMLERAGWKTHTRELACALPHFAQTLSTVELRSTLSNLGFTSNVVRVAGARLGRVPPASTVVDGAGGFWLIEADARGRLHLVQPAVAGCERVSQPVRRTRRYTVVEFEARPDDVAERAQSPEFESWFSAVWTKFRPEVILAFTLAMLSGVITILVSFAITMIFDVVVSSGNPATLWAILAGVGMIFVADLSFRTIRGGLFARVAGRLEYVLGTALFGKLLHLPATMVSSTPISEQMARLRQFETVRDMFTGPVGMLALELPVALMLMIAISVIAWPLGVALGALVLVFLTLSVLFIRTVKQQTRALSSAQSVTTRLILEILANREQIGRDGLAWVMIERFDKSVRELALRRRRLVRTTALLDAVAVASLPASAATVTFVGALLVIAGDLTGGRLVAVTILTWRVVAPMQQIVRTMTKLPNLAGVISQINALMRIPSEEGPLDEPRIGRADGALSLKSVVVRHQKSIMPTIAGATVEIPHGSLVALTGPSGSGKSTLLKVMAGQIAAQSGVVRLGAANVRQMSPAYRGRAIAMIPQTPLFFYGTVAQNLRFSKPEARDDELMALLSELGLADWLARLGDGIHTRLDPTLDGARLTNGVGSAIAVAQALLVKPSLLLLDEPAGGHDPRIEDCLMTALKARRGEMTSVLVSHRPSLVRSMDAVMTLAEGSLKLRKIKHIEGAAP